MRGQIIGLSMVAAVAGACSTDHAAPDYPYMQDKTFVIGGKSGTADGTSDARDAGSDGVPTSSVAVGGSAVNTFTATTPDAMDCLDVGEACVTPQEQCGDKGTADVILGEGGEVLSVICYPNKDYDVQPIGDTVDNPRLGNNTVVTFDDRDDGDDVLGDLVIEGNNVIVYGSGPDTAVVGGNLQIDKNNAIVRGVRIRGDATITKNNASLIYCVIEGDLTITGNNVNLALCEIWGDVKIEGKNAVFVSNMVQGAQPIEGAGLRCNDNHRFTALQQNLWACFGSGRFPSV
jgi:hypothetical protein